MEEPQTQRVSRTMSVKSRAAVNTVEELKARFANLQSRLTQVTEVVSSESSTVQELQAAKLELAQIVGNLEKFQFDEVDAVETHNLSSGKDEVRQQRKDLTRAVTALGEEATSRHEAVAARLDAIAAASGSAGAS